MKYVAGEERRQRGDVLRCVPGLSVPKQFREDFARRTKPPLNAPSMALRGFGGRPVRQFLRLDGTVKER